MRWERIDSKQNPLVIEVGKLNDRKQRTKTGLFRFDGIKLATDAVRFDVPLVALLFRDTEADEVADRILTAAGRPAFPADVRLIRLSDAAFDKLTDEMAPEGVISVARQMTDRHTDEASISADGDMGERIVLLESVRDPSNLGAIVRSAAALGVDRLIVSADCADIYNAKTVRASMGTLFSGIRVERTGCLADIVAALRKSGRRVFAAALDDTAQKLGAFSVMTGDCVVIGNEGHGLTPEVIAACDASVYIPMTDRAESFNAAVAASILMWEFGKQGGLLQ